ncbi:MAG TPA: RNA polymerase sigma factor [Trebonia sp.]|jgi:RNA polymerase sigma factor (sigma-70 family)|nr:RNA polymerase sigma factor [Trebonia sp.]
MSAEDLSHITADPAMFEAFYRRHAVAVSRFLARRATDPQLVADLTAEVFHEVIRSAHGYRPGRGSELAWLYGIARNVLASDRRREALRLRAEQGAAGLRRLDDDDIARLEERIDAEGAARRLGKALASLPDDERAVVELVAVDGLSLKDAALALGIRPGTARVRMFRARRTARDALSPPQDPSRSPSSGGTTSSDRPPSSDHSLSAGTRENR